MRATCCALPGFEEHINHLRSLRQYRICNFPNLQTPQPVEKIRCAVILDFRDEVYASIAGLLKECGLIAYRAENTSELAGKLVSKKPDLVLIHGMQPDENAWLTSAKLRTIDANRPVWIYSPEPPSELDRWLSMVDREDVFVYGGVIHRLLDLLQNRLSPEMAPINPVATDDQRRRTVA